MQAKVPRVASNKKQGEREGTNSLSKPPEGTNPTNTLMSSLWKGERVNLCGFRSSIYGASSEQLWKLIYFVPLTYRQLWSRREPAALEPASPGLPLPHTAWVIGGSTQ